MQKLQGPTPTDVAKMLLIPLQRNVIALVTVQKT